MSPVPASPEVRGGLLGALFTAARVGAGELGASAARVVSTLPVRATAAAAGAPYPAPELAAHVTSVTSAIARVLTQLVGVVENARSSDGTTTSTWIASTRPL